VPALVLALPLAALLIAGLAGRMSTPAGRRALPSRRPARRWSTLTAGAVLVVLIALAAAGLAAAPRDDFGAGAGADLLAWAARQLPDGATLTADRVLAAQLLHAGAASGLVTAEPGSPDRDGPELQIDRGEHSGAAVVIARFAGDGGTPLIVVDPAAELPAPAALDRRRRLGAALLANPTTVAPHAATEALRTGEVDPRLLTLLAGLAARSGVQLAELPAAPGEQGRTPLRSAVVAGVGGRPLAAGAPQLADLRTWLSAQHDPFAPDDVRLVDGGLLIGFRYVTDPDGVLTGAGG
jgi:hypothetical protein